MVVGLFLLLLLGLWVDTDVRRLVVAVSTYGWPFGTAMVVGAVLGVSSVGLIAWWITSVRRAGRAGRLDRTSAANRWRRRVAAAWVIACLATVPATHHPPRFHTAEQWQLTDRLSVAAVTYLLVLVLALAAVIVAIFLVMPLVIRWENAVRRREAAREHPRPADAVPAPPHPPRNLWRPSGKVKKPTRGGAAR